MALSLRRASAPLLTSAILCCSTAAPLRAADFLRGDADESGSLAVTDAVRILHFLFLGQADAVRCQDAADFDDGGSVALTDAIALLAFLFQRGTPPPAPFPACGPDPTQDPLPCDTSECLPEFSFYGFELEGDGVFFVVDRSGTFQNSGGLARAKQEMLATIPTFQPGMEFAVIFADRGVWKWPTGDLPAPVDDEHLASGLAFVRDVRSGSGSCDLR